MQAEEGLFRSVVKSIMSFRMADTQWDAGVCHSSVSAAQLTLYVQ